MEDITLKLQPIENGKPPFKKMVFVKYKRVGNWKPNITLGKLIKTDEKGDDWWIYDQTSFNNEIISWCEIPEF